MIIKIVTIYSILGILSSTYVVEMEQLFKLGLSWVNIAQIMATINLLSSLHPCLINGS